MLSVVELAERYRVSRETVLAWVDAGSLKAIDVSPPGAKRRRLRFSAEQIEEFERQRSTAPVVRQQKSRQPSKKFV